MEGKFEMLEYGFETIITNKGVFVGKTFGHQEAIRRRAAAGWRYVGWLPTKQGSYGSICEIELVFEREREGQA